MKWLCLECGSRRPKSETVQSMKAQFQLAQEQMHFTEIQTGGRRARAVGKGCLVIESFDKVEDEASDKQTREFHKSHVTTLRNTYPLKLMVPSKASDNNSIWVYPITFGGGLVGGDSVEMSFHVKKNCCAVITGQESTKVYHCEEGLRTQQTMTGQVEDGGLLCVLSDPVVCYRKSNFIQSQEFQMSASGNLVYLDWLIGGRVALHELWCLHSYHNKTDVYVDGQLVFRDNYHLQDIGAVSVKEAMHRMQVLGCCILLGSRLNNINSGLNKLFSKKKSIGESYDPGLVCSVSPLKCGPVAGIYIRFMASSSAKAYTEVISHIVEELKPLIGGNPFADKY